MVIGLCVMYKMGANFRRGEKKNENKIKERNLQNHIEFCIYIRVNINDISTLCFIVGGIVWPYTPLIYNFTRIPCSAFIANEGLKKEQRV